jgi:hypothetical protein
MTRSSKPMSVLTDFLQKLIVLLEAHGNITTRDETELRSPRYGTVLHDIIKKRRTENTMGVLSAFMFSIFLCEQSNPAGRTYFSRVTPCHDPPSITLTVLPPFASMTRAAS